MKIDGRSLLFTIAIGLALFAAVYALGLRHGGAGRTTAAVDPAPEPRSGAPSQARVDLPSPTADVTSAAPPAPTTRLATASIGNAESLPKSHPPVPGVRPASDIPAATFTHFRVGNRNIKALLSDGHVMWVGTSGGVIRYDTSNDEYRVFDVRSGLLSNGIFHLSKLGSSLAVGTYGGGLSLFRPETESWENLNVQHGLGDAFVYDVLETTEGDVWIATWSGANRVRGGDLLDRSQWSLFTAENTAGGLPNDWVYGLAQGREGEIWLATEGGLARYDGRGWQSWNHADGLGAPYDVVRHQIEFTRDPARESNHHARQKAEQGLGQVDVAYNPNYIVSLLVDASGIVWCGTWGGGLARFDGEKWRNFTVNDGLPANHVFLLRAGDDGRIWVGTSRGLARFDGSRFENYTTRDGLFADNVFSLARDAQNTLWVGSYGGVARISELAPRM